MTDSPPPDSERPHPTTPLPTEPVPERTGRAARFRQGPWRLLVAAVLVLVVVAAVAQLIGMLPRWSNPLGEREIDRSQPVLLERIQDISRYEAASGNFQVIIDLEKDARFIPSEILGERTLFVAAGSVDAYVDFSGIGKGAIRASDERHEVTVTLPHAKLESVNLDHRRTYVYAQRKGVLNQLGDLFGENPNAEQKLYRLAEMKIGRAADRSGLATRAESNTRAMLVGMLGSMGYSKVTVRFADPGS